MTPQERDARNLIAEGALEKIADIEHEGQRVAASRLGYRMTERLATKYFGRIFLHPHVVFTPEMLRPELQDVAVFAESIATIVMHPRAGRRAPTSRTARSRWRSRRCGPCWRSWPTGPPRRAGRLESPEFRAHVHPRVGARAPTGTPQRLDAKQAAASGRADAGLAAIEKFVTTPGNEEPTARLGMPARVAAARAEAERLSGAAVPPSSSSAPRAARRSDSACRYPVGAAPASTGSRVPINRGTAARRPSPIVGWARARPARRRAGSSPSPAGCPTRGSR